MKHDDADDLIRPRHEKLAALRAAGIDPFGGRFPVTHWARPLSASPASRSSGGSAP